MNAYKPNLPKTIGVWTISDSVRLVDSTNIFKYMNGAGELYLGYSFDHLEVFDYKSENQDNILVEIYFMNNSDDAFGLLSLDWTGEPISLNSFSSDLSDHDLTPRDRALYGAGLLRLWSDNIYARVMAHIETPASREAVLSLGRAIVADHTLRTEPELLNALLHTIDSNWQLQKDRIGYFRSHLVLNSLYYISHQNILNLDISTQAVTAPYKNIADTKNQNQIQFLLIQYMNPALVQQAMERFHNAYLSEYKQNFQDGSITKKSVFFELEDGWLGYKLNSKYILLVFECPDQKAAEIIIQRIESNLP